MKEIILTIKNKAMEFFAGLMVANTWVNGQMVIKMEKANSLIKMDQLEKESGLMVKDKFGLMISKTEHFYFFIFVLAELF